MSKQQYDLKTKTDYLNRRMFLDAAGPVTIQRFEEVKYPKLQKMEQEARGFFCDYHKPLNVKPKKNAKRSLGGLF